MKIVVELWRVEFVSLLEMRAATVVFQMKQSPKYNIGINDKTFLGGQLSEILFWIELDSQACDWIEIRHNREIG